MHKKQTLEVFQIELSHNWCLHLLYFIHHFGIRLLIFCLIIASNYSNPKILWLVIFVVQTFCFLTHFLRIYIKCIDYILALLWEFLILISICFCGLSQTYGYNSYLFNVIFMVVYLSLIIIMILVVLSGCCVRVGRYCFKLRNKVLKKRMNEDSHDFKSRFEDSVGKLKK